MDAVDLQSAIRFVVKTGFRQVVVDRKAYRKIRDELSVLQRLPSLRLQYIVYDHVMIMGAHVVMLRD